MGFKQFDKIDEKDKSRQMTDREFEYLKKVLERDMDAQMRKEYSRHLNNLKEAYERYKEFMNKFESSF